MTQIFVSSHGLRREEPSGQAIDRPYGIGQFLLVRFLSPMKVRAAHGVVPAEPGQVLLFAPGHPQWYQGRAGTWINDWMHLKGDGVAFLAQRHGVPVNELLSPSDTRFFPRLFDEIQHEKSHAEDNWEEAVELLACQLFLKLGRALRDPTAQFTPAEAEHLPVFRRLRQRVHEQLAQRWTVTAMAAEVGLSPSRFAALYQRFFGVSPLEDLLRARLQNAQTLLTNRAMPVGQAAARSGFCSVHYFSRVFHQRTGCAPSDYHRVAPQMQRKPPLASD